MRPISSYIRLIQVLASNADRLNWSSSGSQIAGSGHLPRPSLYHKGPVIIQAECGTAEEQILGILLHGPTTWYGSLRWIQYCYIWFNTSHCVEV